MRLCFNFETVERSRLTVSSVDVKRPHVER